MYLYHNSSLVKINKYEYVGTYNFFFCKYLVWRARRRDSANTITHDNVIIALWENDNKLDLLLILSVWVDVYIAF